MANQYKYGRRKENQVKAFLESELPPSKLGGICGANSRTFAARVRFAAPKDAACHPTLRFIPAASCGVFSPDFYKGAVVKLSPGSKGPVDAVAKFPTKTWVIQIKSSRRGPPSSLKPKELKGLVKKAEQIGATPVISEVEGNKVSFVSAKINRKLKP